MNAENATTQTISSTHGCATVGTMPQDLTAQDGWTMSNAVAWFQTEKSFVISRGHILLSAIVLFGFIIAFSFFLSKRLEVVDINGQRFQVTGMARTMDQDREIFMPVYKEIK